MAAVRGVRTEAGTVASLHARAGCGWPLMDVQTCGGPCVRRSVADNADGRIPVFPCHALQGRVFSLHWPCVRCNCVSFCSFVKFIRLLAARARRDWEQWGCVVLLCWLMRGHS